MPPESFTGDASSCSHAPEFGQSHLWVSADSKTTIGAGHDPFSAHDLGEAKQALGNQLWVFHYRGAMADYTRYEDLIIRQLDIPPQSVLMLMSAVGRLEEVGPGVDLQHQVYYVFQRYVA